MDNIRTLKGLLARLGEAYPSPIGVNEGFVDLSIPNADAQELHRDIAHLMMERDRLKNAVVVLRGIVHELDPKLYNELYSLGLT